MNRRVVVALGAVLAAVVILVGGTLALLAGGGGSSGSSGSSGGAGSVASAPEPGYAAAPDSETGAAGTAADSNDPLSGSSYAVARDVVRTAQLSVTADDPTAAADRAGRIAVAAGGRVEQDTRGEGASLVLRVPADALDTALSDLAALGRETSRQVGGDDVTAQTADLGARVSALQTSVARLQALIGTSGNLADLLAAETQLTQRQAELESLQAQQRALADQVSLATITLTLVTPTAAAPGADPTGFGDAVASGWHAFTVTLRYLVAAVGYALPMLVLLALAAAAVVVRRRRRGSTTPPADPDPTPAPTA